MHEVADTIVAVNHDLPCCSCGYNLRGLDQRSRCPECGYTIRASIMAFVHRRQRLDDVDPHWLRQLLEGAWLAIVAWLLVLAMCLTPTPTRIWFGTNIVPWKPVLLGTACGWWVLTWVALLKLARAEPGAHQPLDRWLLPLLRFTATAYVLLPFMVGLAYDTWFDDYVALPAFLLILSGSLAAFAMWIRVWDLACRDRRPWFALQCLMLAFASPIAFWVAISIGHVGLDSLSLMVMLPLPGIGWPIIVADAFDGPSWFFSGLRVTDLLLLAHAIMAFVTIVQFAFVISLPRRRAARREPPNAACSNIRPRA